MIGEHLTWPVPPCCGWPGKCGCPPMERALRGWARSDTAMPAMTAEQRQFCLDEIKQVEGYDVADWQDGSDHAVAATVLSAWLDYCRDKGLL